MDNPLVSIIIPVHNVDMFLEDCLDSVCSQSYCNIQIICINDGSVDSSLAILKRYEQKDKRIQVISQDKQGVSVARNNGLDIARGEYIMFVDSDDMLYKNSVELCMDIFKAEDDLDGIVFNAMLFDEDGTVGLCIRDTFKEKSFPRIIESRSSEFVAVVTNIWLLCIPRKILEENHIRFLDFGFSEDAEFCSHYLSLTNKIYWLNRPLYNYRISRQGSIVTTVSNQYMDNFAAYRKGKQNFINAGTWNVVEYYFYRRNLGHLIHFWHEKIKSCENKELIDLFKKELTAFVNEIPKLMLYSMLVHFDDDRLFLLGMRPDTSDYAFKRLQKSRASTARRIKIKNFLRSMYIKISPSYRLALYTRDQVNYVSWRVDQLRTSYNNNSLETTNLLDQISATLRQRHGD